MDPQRICLNKGREINMSWVTLRQEAKKSLSSNNFYCSQENVNSINFDTLARKNTIFSSLPKVNTKIEVSLT